MSDENEPRYEIVPDEIHGGMKTIRIDSDGTVHDVKALDVPMEMNWMLKWSDNRLPFEGLHTLQSIVKEPYIGTFHGNRPAPSDDDGGELSS